MSLPSYAHFYDENDVELSRQFINCGWWVDAQSVARAIIEQLTPVLGAKYIRVYGIDVPTSELVIQWDKEDTDEYELRIRALVGELLFIENEAIRKKKELES